MTSESRKRVFEVVIISIIGVLLIAIFSTEEAMGERGREGDEELLVSDYAIISNGTHVSSVIYEPIIACSGSNVYALWRDSGDLDFCGEEMSVFFKRSTDNGSTWEEPMCFLREASYLYAMDADGDNVGVAWEKYGRFYFRCSDDAGITWGEVLKISDDGGTTISISVSGSHYYIAWSNRDMKRDQYVLMFASSDGGEEWDIEYIWEEDRPVIPRIDSTGPHVYIVWSDFNATDGMYLLRYTYSSDYGIEFLDEPVEIKQVNESYVSPKVACAEDGHVYALWVEDTGPGFALYSSYSKDHGKDGTWSDNEKLYESNNLIQHTMSAVKVGSEYHVYASWQSYSSGIQFTRSVNESAWVEAVSLNKDDIHEGSWVCSNDQGKVYVSYGIRNFTSGQFVADVYMNISRDVGKNWEEGVLVTDELFDGDSRTPSLGTDGEDVFLVWSEIGEVSGYDNGMDGDILFTMQGQAGAEESIILSDHEKDGGSADPTIGVDGNNIYVAWVEYGDMDGIDIDHDIVFSYSSDGGESWGPVTLVTDYDGDGYSIRPEIAVSGPDAYLTWQDDGNISGSGEDNDVYFCRIRSGVLDQEIMLISEGCNENSQYPDIDIIGDTVVLIWDDLTDYLGNGMDSDIFFRRSTDSGEHWEEIRVLTDDAGSSRYPALSSGPELHAAWWEYQNGVGYLLFHTRSEDNGITWYEGTKVEGPGLDVCEPEITVHGEEVYLTYEDEGVWVVFSYDGGKSWEEPVTVTVSDPDNIAGQSLAYVQNRLHLVWEDKGNISGSGYDYDIVYANFRKKPRISIISPLDRYHYGREVSVEWETKHFEPGDELRIEYHNGTEWIELDVALASEEFSLWNTSMEVGGDYHLRLSFMNDSTIITMTDWFIVDNKPPVTKPDLTVENEFIDAIGNRWGSSVELRFHPMDDFEGGGQGSGVNHTYYRVNRGSWMEYIKKLEFDSSGFFSIDFHSIDMTNNEEKWRSINFSVDTSKPGISWWDFPDVKYSSPEKIMYRGKFLDDGSGFDSASFNDDFFQYSFGEPDNRTKYQGWKNASIVSIVHNVQEFTAEITEGWGNLSMLYGNFTLFMRLTVHDNVTNEWVGIIEERVETDTDPPVIISVGSRTDEDEDDSYHEGSSVLLTVRAGEDALTGTAYIRNGAASNGDYEVSLVGDGFTYSVHWDTSGLLPGSYSVIFTLRDRFGNEVQNDDLLVDILERRYPELEIDGITVQQNGVNGIEHEIYEARLTVISAVVTNLGSLDVNDGILELRLISRDSVVTLGTVQFSIPNGASIVLNASWIPEFGEEEYAIAARIHPIDGEKNVDNNEAIVNLKGVLPLADFQCIDVGFKDVGGVEISHASVGESVFIVVTIRNGGHRKAKIDVIAALENGMNLTDVRQIELESGSTGSVTLEWIPTAEGTWNVSAMLDPGNQIMEIQKENNVLTSEFTVRENTGEGSKDSSSAWMIATAVIGIGFFGIVLWVFHARNEHE